MRDRALDGLECGSAGLHFAGGPLKLRGAILGIDQRGADALGTSSSRWATPALCLGVGRLGEMLARLVERSTPLLQLLAEHADAAFDFIELAGAALERSSTEVPTTPMRRSASATDAATPSMVSATCSAWSAFFASCTHRRLGAVHAAFEALHLLDELAAGAADFVEAAGQVTHDFAPGRDFTHGALHLLDLVTNPGDLGLHRPELLDLRLDLPDPGIAGAETGLRFRMAFAEASHLFVGHAHPLETVGHKLVRALERHEVLHRLIHVRLEVVDPLHPAGDLVGDVAIRSISCLSEDNRAASSASTVQLGGELCRVLAEGPHLGLNGRGALAGGVEHIEPGLALLDGIAKVGDALAHRVQPPVLQLESLAALPHLLAQVGERLFGALHGVLILERGRLQLLAPGDDLGLDRLDLLDLCLDGAEAADLLFLTAKPDVELPVEPGELGDLGGGPLHGLALLLKHPALLRYLLGQRLQYREAVLQIRHRGDGLANRLEGPLHGLHPPDDVFQAAGGGLVLFVERLET